MFQKQRSSPLLPLFLVVFIDLLGFGIIIPIVGVLFLDPSHGLFPDGTALATRTFMMGLFLASYAICSFFSAPIMGMLSDRHGRKKLLLVSIAGTFIGYALIAYAISEKSLALLFLGRIIDGLTGGNISIAQSAIADLSDEKSKAKNFGLIGMAFGLGFIAGPFIGGKLSDPSVVSWFNFTTPFWFSAALSGLNLILLFFVFNETLRTHKEGKLDFFQGVKNVKRAFAMPNLRVMFLVIFLFSLGFSFFTQFFQVFLIEKFKFNQSQIGDFFALLGVFAALTQGIVVRQTASRYLPAKILSIALFGLSITFLLFLIPSQAYWLYAIIPLQALFQGLSFPNSLAIVSNLADRQSQGEVLGLNSSVQSLGMALPPLIAGVISAVDYTLPTLAASACLLLAWFVFVFVFKPKQTQHFHEQAGA